MKKVVLFITLIMINMSIYSQPIPSGGQGHGTTGNQPGGGAPIDGGLSILLVLSIAYVAKKKLLTIKSKSY